MTCSPHYRPFGALPVELVSRIVDKVEARGCLVSEVDNFGVLPVIKNKDLHNLSTTSPLLRDLVQAKFFKTVTITARGFGSRATNEVNVRKYSFKRISIRSNHRIGKFVRHVELVGGSNDHNWMFDKAMVDLLTTLCKNGLVRGFSVSSLGHHQINGTKLSQILFPILPVDLARLSLDNVALLCSNPFERFPSLDDLTWRGVFFAGGAVYDSDDSHSNDSAVVDDDDDISVYTTTSEDESGCSEDGQCDSGLVTGEGEREGWDGCADGYSDHGCRDDGSGLGSEDRGSESGIEDGTSTSDSEEEGSEAGNEDGGSESGSEAGGSESGSEAGGSESGSEAGGSESGSEAGGSESGSEDGGAASGSEDEMEGATTDGDPRFNETLAVSTSNRVILRKFTYSRVSPAIGDYIGPDGDSVMGYVDLSRVSDAHLALNFKDDFETLSSVLEAGSFTLRTLSLDVGILSGICWLKSARARLAEALEDMDLRSLCLYVDSEKGHGRQKDGMNPGLIGMVAALELFQNTRLDSVHFTFRFRDRKGFKSLVLDGDWTKFDGALVSLAESSGILSVGFKFEGDPYNERWVAGPILGFADSDLERMLPLSLACKKIVLDPLSFVALT